MYWIRPCWIHAPHHASVRNKLVLTFLKKSPTARGPIEETAAGNLTPKVFLEVVLVKYPVHK